LGPAYPPQHLLKSQFPRLLFSWFNTSSMGKTSPYTLAAYWTWAALFLVWLHGSLSGKKSGRKPRPVLQVITSTLLLASFLLLFKAQSLPGILAAQVSPPAGSLGLAGLALDIIGVGLAIWARVTLGSSWSGFITVKQNHQLVQRGPYALVRHPIYSGLLSAIIGAALTIGTLGSYAAVIAGLAAILIRIEAEEALMSEQFPETHRAYRERTRKLIPLLW